QHRAPDRIAAEQCALRAAQHLNVIDVEEVHCAADGATHVYVVDIDADTRVHGRRRVELADAAYEDDRRRVVAGELAVARELQARRYPIEIRRRLNLPTLEGFCRQRRDGYGYILQSFLSPP